MVVADSLANFGARAAAVCGYFAFGSGTFADSVLAFAS